MKNIAHEIRRQLVAPLVRDILPFFLIGSILGILIAFSGCGDVTATMVPPAAAEPPGRGQADASAKDSGPDATPPQGGTAEVASDVHVAPTDAEEVGIISPDAGATDVRPEHPVANCVPRTSAEYKITVCAVGCGTCLKLGEVDIYAQGCWTAEDFHCVASCADCPRS